MGRLHKDVLMRFAARNRIGFRTLVAKALLATAVLLVARAGLTAQTTRPEAAVAEAPRVAPAPAVPPLSPTDLFWKAGAFIWPLTACSVLAVALIIERMIALRRRRVVPAGFLPVLRQIYRDPAADRDRALDYCRREDSPLARMIAAGIRRMPRGYAAAEKAIEDAGAGEAMRLRQNMRFLYSLGSVATLLGLIGTIWGMIKAFHQVASVEGAGHAELSEGIYEAMVNTFAGLAIAIVVTVFYYYFAGRIDRLVSDLNDAANEFGRDMGFDSSPADEAVPLPAIP